MSSMRTIVDALENTRERVVLATVVRITGSSYGGVGARMVIQPDGRAVGMVSGGCLEADLAEHAALALREHVPRLVTYDTRADDDAAWGLGLGCNGLIDVLLEPLHPHEARQVGALLAMALESPSRSVLATTIHGDTSTPVGAHALFADGAIETIGSWPSELLRLAGRDIADAFPEARRGLVREYDAITVAFEVISPAINLLICGSGPDVVPLVRLAAGLGWNLTVVDHRPVLDAHPERFPGASVLDCPDPRSLGAVTNVTPHTAAVVMSHNYARDLDYVRSLLSTESPYIGVLGPRARTERMLADIASLGEIIPEGSRLFSPVGLDIGGDGPESIAVSIIAEVAAVIHGRTGGHLRDRRGSLHPSLAPQPAIKF